MNYKTLLPSPVRGRGQGREHEICPVLGGAQKMLQAVDELQKFLYEYYGDLKTVKLSLGVCDGNTISPISSIRQ